MPRPTAPVISNPRPLSTYPSAHTHTNSTTSVNAHPRQHGRSLSTEPKSSFESSRSLPHHRNADRPSNGRTRDVQVKFERELKPEREQKRTVGRTEEEPQLPQPPKPLNTDTRPSIKLLYSMVTRRDFLLLLLPAMIMSIISGGIAPFMTFVVGQAFDAFSRFPLSDPSPEDKADLRRSVGIAAIQLVALGAAALALSSATSALWICNGERNLMRLRSVIYDAVMNKSMEWFEVRMGASEKSDTEDDERSGSGGLMAKFAVETDDVRAATSLASGFLLQHLTTCIACFVFALTRSAPLTFVILSSVPVLAIVQAIVQRFVRPFHAQERKHTSSAATLIERAATAIATVKAYNATQHEFRAASSELEKGAKADKRANIVWAFSAGSSQFFAMAMFVQGFWFGAKLVRDGSVSPGDVMAVFWACLIATNGLQMTIPQLIIFTKGKLAMASLMNLVNSPDSQDPHSQVKDMARALVRRRKQSTQTRHRQGGQLVLENITFSYPSRPSVRVLTDISLYLPSRETTFIVGGSGSGKSTIAQLLMRLYHPQHGHIYLDDENILRIDDKELRSHIALVAQSCILFDGTVHENVAMGVAGTGMDPASVKREDVIKVCTTAMMHEFVRDLPDGYDTQLGTNGASLSGGQKQRLAIARALLRDPAILILDEATSALDAISRVLVFEAIKTRRKNKTTIVITHDLSQITPKDFAYVLKDGLIFEQGYREDLELSENGEFRRLVDAQGETGGFPVKEDDDDKSIYSQTEGVPNSAAIIGRDPDSEDDTKRMTIIDPHVKHFSSGNALLGGWVLRLLNESSHNVPPLPTAISSENRHSHRQSYRHNKSLSVQASKHSLGRARGSVAFKSSTVDGEKQVKRVASMPLSRLKSERSLRSKKKEHELLDFEHNALTRAATIAMQRRLELATKRSDGKQSKQSDSSDNDSGIQLIDPEQLSFLGTLGVVLRTVPHKWMIVMGLFVCLLSGATTPVFSFVLARLLFEVSGGAQNASVINMFGGIVLGIAAADGLFMGLKVFIMEVEAMEWITHLRKTCYDRILIQDKKWFDREINAPVRLVQLLIKDVEDAKNMVAVIIGQCVVVVTMLSVGIIWALSRGWQLTLAGLAFAPVFAIAMSLQANFAARCERNNKATREAVAKRYYDSVSNILAIRCISFEAVFKKRFDEAVEKAHASGVKGAFVEGSAYGLASGLIYLAEALLFFVGAVLVSQGTYTYLQMVEVFNLVVFSISIGSQLMVFTQRIAKASQATRSVNTILTESIDTDESRGSAEPPLNHDIRFNRVEFAYPERPDVPVLQSATFRIRRGECVALVGTSGSGKSTVAGLLQRLYEPTEGSITIGHADLSTVNVQHLRDHVAIVSQFANLFNATIAENIAYGNRGLSRNAIERAAKAACVHDFIMSLPKGYDTVIGDNATLVSGGQAQRIQIARALVRPSNILILDECTSSLDPANQLAVMDTIRSVKVGRTTIVITHKLPVMHLCDRIIVLHEGEMVEEGTFSQLMHRNDVFARLARGGEWTGA